MGSEIFDQVVEDADTYHLIGKGEDIEWDVTFHRVFGYYGSHDSEKSMQDPCLMSSSLWGYDSEVSGKITQRNKTYTFTRSPRYRGYAAGSWGCGLPSGTPSIKYPWSWAWLVIPNPKYLSPPNTLISEQTRMASKTKYIDNNYYHKTEVGIALGMANLDSKSKIGGITGCWGVIGVNDIIYSLRSADILSNTMFEFPLLASSSDEFLVECRVNRTEWSTYSDALGKAQIPLKQQFILVTKHYSFVIEFKTTINQYFRAPVFTQTDGQLHMFSDYRAVGVSAHVLITTRGPSPVTILDMEVGTHNAVEFAYESELDDPSQIPILFNSRR